MMRPCSYLTLMQHGEQQEIKQFEKEWTKLLEERARIRLEAWGTEEDELYKLQWQLIRVTREIRSARAQLAKSREQAALDEAWESWRLRQFSQMWRALYRLAGAGAGPRGRNYRRPQMQTPTRENWTRELEAPPHQGGMKANMVNREQEVERMLEEVDPLPGEDANQMVQAEADRKGVEAALVKAAKR